MQNDGGWRSFCVSTGGHQERSILSAFLLVIHGAEPYWTPGEAIFDKGSGGLAMVKKLTPRTGIRIRSLPSPYV